MFFIVAGMMLVGLQVSLRMMPQVTQSFKGSYRQLMRTVGHIFVSYPRIRLYSLRPAMSFASMMSVWSCMAFHMAGAPFHAGSDAVGMLALCGVVGAVAACGAGKLVPRWGILFSGLGWSLAGWEGVCVVGCLFAFVTLLISVYELLFMKQ